jgi:hypothetical protein
MLLVNHVKIQLDLNSEAVPLKILCNFVSFVVVLPPPGLIIVDLLFCRGI